MDPMMKFAIDLESGEIQGKPMGRINLGDGSVCRLWLLPDGLHLVCPPSNFLHVAEPYPLMTGLGPLTDSKKRVSPSEGRSSDEVSK